MTYQNLLLDRPEPGVHLLTINRPRALNALNAATLVEIEQAIAEIAADGAVRALLITGAGDRAFVAGADIAEMQDFSVAEAREFSSLGMRVMRAVEELPVPAIALVNGFCLGGGCELALACDWIVASESAVFGQPEVNLGIPPGFGGTQRLPRRIGAARALELLTTARQVKAAEALSIGLVNHVCAAGALREKGMELARAIAARAPVAVRLAKRAVRGGRELDLAAACALETGCFAEAFGTADRREGMAAFLAKRPAQFENR